MWCLIQVFKRFNVQTYRGEERVDDQQFLEGHKDWERPPVLVQPVHTAIDVEHTARLCKTQWRRHTSSLCFSGIQHNPIGWASHFCHMRQRWPLLSICTWGVASQVGLDEVLDHHLLYAVVHERKLEAELLQTRRKRSNDNTIGEYWCRKQDKLFRISEPLLNAMYIVAVELDVHLLVGEAAEVLAAETV